MNKERQLILENLYKRRFMELDVSPQEMIGSPISFGRRREIWIIRDMIVLKQNSGRFRYELFCLIVAKEKAPESENQVRLVLFSADDLSGDIDSENHLFLYLNEKKSATVHMSFVEQPFRRTA
jgi:hypothetical protein